MEAKLSPDDGDDSLVKAAKPRSRLLVMKDKLKQQRMKNAEKNIPEKISKIRGSAANGVQPQSRLPTTKAISNVKHNVNIPELHRNMNNGNNKKVAKSKGLAYEVKSSSGDESMRSDSPKDSRKLRGLRFFHRNDKKESEKKVEKKIGKKSEKSHSVEMEVEELKKVKKDKRRSGGGRFHTVNVDLGDIERAHAIASEDQIKSYNQGLDTHRQVAHRSQGTRFGFGLVMSKSKEQLQDQKKDDHSSGPSSSDFNQAGQRDGASTQPHNCQPPASRLPVGPLSPRLGGHPATRLGAYSSPARLARIVRGPPRIPQKAEEVGEEEVWQPQQPRAAQLVRGATRRDEIHRLVHEGYSTYKAIAKTEKCLPMKAADIDKRLLASTKSDSLEDGARLNAEETREDRMWGLTGTVDMDLCMPPKDECSMHFLGCKGNTAAWKIERGNSMSVLDTYGERGRAVKTKYTESEMDKADAKFYSSLSRDNSSQGEDLMKEDDFVSGDQTVVKKVLFEQDRQMEQEDDKTVKIRPKHPPPYHKVVAGVKRRDKGENSNRKHRKSLSCDALLARRDLADNDSESLAMNRGFREAFVLAGSMNSIVDELNQEARQDEWVGQRSERSTTGKQWENTQQSIAVPRQYNVISVDSSNFYQTLREYNASKYSGAYHSELNRPSSARYQYDSGIYGAVMEHGKAPNLRISQSASDLYEEVCEDRRRLQREKLKLEGLKGILVDRTKERFRGAGKDTQIPNQDYQNTGIVNNHCGYRNDDDSLTVEFHGKLPHTTSYGSYNVQSNKINAYGEVTSGYGGYNAPLSRETPVVSNTSERTDVYEKGGSLYSDPRSERLHSTHPVNSQVCGSSPFLLSPPAPEPLPRIPEADARDEMTTLERSKHDQRRQAQRYRTASENTVLDSLQQAAKKRGKPMTGLDVSDPSDFKLANERVSERSHERSHGPRRHTVTVDGMDLETAMRNNSQHDLERQRELFAKHLAEKYPQYAEKIRNSPVFRGRDAAVEPERRRRQTVEVSGWCPEWTPCLPAGSGFVRGGRLRASLPIVRSPNMSQDRTLGLAFLQHQQETKRTLLPNEITSLDTVRALFVRTFPGALSMAWFERHPHHKVYIMDRVTSLYYELEDMRDVKDRCVLKIYETGAPGQQHLSVRHLLADASFTAGTGYDSDSSARSAPPAVCSTVETKPCSLVEGASPHLHRAFAPPVMSPGVGAVASPILSRSLHLLLGDSENTSGSATPTVNMETKQRMEKMEKQLESLTSLVQAACSNTPQHADKPAVPPNKPKLNPQVLKKGVANLSTDTLQPGPSDRVVSAQMEKTMLLLRERVRTLQAEMRVLRRQQEATSQAVRDTIRNVITKIQVLLSSGHFPVDQPVRLERQTVNQQTQTYRSNSQRILTELIELDAAVEEVRSDVLSKRCRVNEEEVESMAISLSNISRQVAELKGAFPSLQEALKHVIMGEMEVVVQEEKFLKEEPARLESALKKCKKLTGTLFTLKRLACVQETRSPAIPHFPAAPAAAADAQRAILNTISTLAPDHEARVSGIKKCESSRERKRKLSLHAATLRFEKSLALAQKQLRETDNVARVEERQQQLLQELYKEYQNSHSTGDHTQQQQPQQPQQQQPQQQQAVVRSSSITPTLQSNDHHPDNLRNGRQGITLAPPSNQVPQPPSDVYHNTQMVNPTSQCDTTSKSEPVVSWQFTSQIPSPTRLPTKTAVVSPTSKQLVVLPSSTKQQFVTPTSCTRVVVSPTTGKNNIVLPTLCRKSPVTDVRIVTSPVAVAEQAAGHVMKVSSCSINSNIATTATSFSSYPSSTAVSLNSKITAVASTPAAINRETDTAKCVNNNHMRSSTKEIFIDSPPVVPVIKVKSKAPMCLANSTPKVIGIPRRVMVPGSPISGGSGKRVPPTPPPRKTSQLSSSSTENSPKLGVKKDVKKVSFSPMYENVARVKSSGEMNGKHDQCTCDTKSK